MTWKLPLVMVLALAAGCGGSGGGARTNGITQKQLDGALLTVADVPPGYKLDKKVAPQSTAAPAAGTDCPTRFAGLGRVSGGGKVLTAQARFQGPKIGTVLQQTVARIEDKGAVAKRLGEVRSVVTECPSFTLGSGSTGQAVRLSLLDVGTLGDQTVAYRVTITSGGVAYAADEVLCAVGRSIVLLAQGGLATPDLVLVKAATTTAVARLQRLPA